MTLITYFPVVFFFLQSFDAVDHIEIYISVIITHHITTTCIALVWSLFLFIQMEYLLPNNKKSNQKFIYFEHIVIMNHAND